MPNNAELPISKAQAQKAVGWLELNFGEAIKKAVIGTPFKAEYIYGIACQETAYKWLLWIDKYSPTTVLARCVFDASGDMPNTSRSAFPKNKQAFIDKYGSDFTNLLIKESNLQRAMPQPNYPKGFQPAPFLYKGYGIFQYDLQAVVTDEIFFKEKQWYSFDECLKRVMKELNGKYAITKDIYKSIRAYNGSGVAAENYAKNVMQFTQWV